jgi:hypothetical protein
MCDARWAGLGASAEAVDRPGGDRFLDSCDREDDRLDHGSPAQEGRTRLPPLDDLALVGLIAGREKRRDHSRRRAARDPWPAGRRVIRAVDFGISRRSRD